MDLQLEVITTRKADESVINEISDMKIKEAEKCPICLECFENYIEFPVCNHKFHKACLIDHLRTSCHCPICRQEVKCIVTTNVPSEGEEVEEVEEPGLRRRRGGGKTYKKNRKSTKKKNKRMKNNKKKRKRTRRKKNKF